MQNMKDRLMRRHPYLDPLVQLISKAGGHPFLVGGSVRDLLGGNQVPGDLDVEVFGLSPGSLERALKKKYAFEYVGKSFGVYLLKDHPVDIALPRTEIRTGHKHTDFQVQSDPHLSIKQAAARRDFTMNAIYLDLTSGEIHDPYGGIQDFEHGLLRHTSHQFAEDALRVYRAMQFIARFELTCAAETLRLCQEMDGSHLPVERVFQEIEKLLLSGSKPSLGLRFLRDCGWIRHFPELENLIHCPQDPQWHPEGDVWTHTLLCVDAYAKRRVHDREEDLIVGLAVLCHDMGKPATTVEEDGRIRSPRHDVVGVETARSFLNRITRNRNIIESVLPLVKEHMNPMALYRSDAGVGAVRRLALRVEKLERLLRVCQADREGREQPWSPKSFPEGDWLREKMRELNLRDNSPKPIIKGRDLIAHGLEPGPQFGEILEHLFQAQLDGEFDNHDQGMQFLRQWLRKH